MMTFEELHSRVTKKKLEKEFSSPGRGAPDDAAIWNTTTAMPARSAWEGAWPDASIASPLVTTCGTVTDFPDQPLQASRVDRAVVLCHAAISQMHEHVLHEDYEAMNMQSSIIPSTLRHFLPFLPKCATTATL